MASENIHRLQDTFLKHLQKKRTPVTVFLVNGVKLQGVVTDFDAFCVLLERDGQSQIIYKHAISAALPAYAVDLRDDADTPDKAAPPNPAATRPPVIVERRRSRFARP
jgi:host factor-I protein